MKKLILLLAALINLTVINLFPILSAQEMLKGQLPQLGCSCLPQGITFTTQEQIDNFQTNYPGCTEIEGDVYITSVESDISNLQGLSLLTTIGGMLWINTTYDLVNLEGLNGIISIGGDLVIGNASMGGSGNQSLEDFSGLNNLETIGGDFSVSFNPILINFQGLSSLVTVGGDFIVGYNPSLINLEGIGNLISIGENLVLGSNESMTNLTGLDNLSSIGGELSINGNSVLNVCEAEWLCAYLDSPTGAVNIRSNAAGCNSVIEVAIACGAIPCLPYGNYLINSQSDIDNFQVVFPECEELQGNVRVSGNDITDLSGLNDVTFIEGNLEFYYNNILTSLFGLDNLTSIGGNLSISGNESLTTCDAEWLCDLLANTGGSVSISNNAQGCSSVTDVALSCGGLPCLPNGYYGFYTQADIDNFSLAFPGCSDLEGSVGIGGNEITNLNGLNQVTSIGGNLRFYNAYALQSLMGLGNLTSIGGYLEFWQNNSLTSLTGIENLTTIGGDLDIYKNNALTSLTGLENLTSIGGTIEFEQNNSLTSLTGIENLTTIGGDLDIDNNNALTSLTGLENLTSIGGNLSLRHNFALTSMIGMDNLVSIGGDFSIWGNYSLNNLSGLENLTSIGGKIDIVINTALTSLIGLENIAASSISDLIIIGNTSLSTCHVQSICEYMAAPYGTVTIHSNATGCNSVAEVIAACATVGLEEIAAGSDLLISPNPFTDQLTIEFDLPQTSAVSIQIFNTMGVMVAELHNSQLPAGQQQFRWYAGDLPGGMYFFRVQAGSGVATRKMIKY